MARQLSTTKTTTTRAPPAVADLDLALATISCIVRGGDLRRLPVREDLRRRIVGAIVNLECILAMIERPER